MMQQLKSLLPEVLLMCATLYYWSLTASTFNWLAIAFMALLIFLLVSKNRAVGLLLGSVIILLNLYLVFALLSEFYEFSEFNDKAKDLLLFGSLFIGTNLILAVWLIYKYAIKVTNTENIDIKDA